MSETGSEQMTWVLTVLGAAGSSTPGAEQVGG